MVDVIYFIVIFCVVLLAYGIGRWAILKPGGAWGISDVQQLLVLPYFQILGETSIELLETNSKSITVLVIIL